MMKSPESPESPSASCLGADEDSDVSHRLLGATGGSVASGPRPPRRRTSASPPATVTPTRPFAVRRTVGMAAITSVLRGMSGLKVAAGICLLVLLATGAAMIGSGGKFVDYDGYYELPEGVSRAEFPVSRDLMPGWTAYHQQLKANAEEDGAAARVLLLGDSITEELLETQVGMSRSNWGSLAVWMEYYAYLGGINLGLSGDQTQHLLWRLQNGELPDVLQPESILVAIGTNNLGAGMSARDTVGGIKAVVKYVREQQPDALVCVMALFPRADPKDKSSHYPWPGIDEVNDLLERMLRQKFGKEKVRFIDCTERFLAQDATGRPVLDGKLIMSDNLHLTKEGLDAWADCAEADIHAGLREG